MTLFVDYVSLLKLILSTRGKHGDYGINIMKDYDFGNNIGLMTLSQHIHFLFQALVDSNDIYRHDHYIESHTLSLEHIASKYKQERFKDVCAMFHMISPTCNMNYFDMERFICSLPLPIIKQIMGCMFISYEELYNTYLPRQAPRLSVDTEEICYIPRHYGTVNMTKSKSQNRMISRIRSCLGFPKYEEYVEEEKESICQ